LSQIAQSAAYAAGYRNSVPAGFRVKDLYRREVVLQFLRSEGDIPATTILGNTLRPDNAAVLIAAKLNVNGTTTFSGPALSVRSCVRVGSTFSLFDFANLGSSLSLRGNVRFGSTLSVYSLARLGSSLSVLDFVRLGSALSIRSFSRLGSTLSVYSFARLGSTLSVLDFVTLGSSFSLRSCVRFGSTLSVYGLARLGSSLSVLDFVTLGSSLSLRGFARLGSSLSLSGMARFGTRAVFSRPGELNAAGMSTEGGSDELAQSYIGLRSEAISTDADRMEIAVAGVRSATFSGTGGELHGVWLSEAAIALSDRRLKTNISPLELALKDGTPRSSSDMGPMMPVSPGGGPLWVLRQLRPVSYNFKEGSDKNQVRFGFVADELQPVVPEVVRELQGSAGERAKDVERRHPTAPDGAAAGGNTKAVAYQDLIAVLTSVAQSQQAANEQLNERVAMLEERLARKATLHSDDDAGTSSSSSSSSAGSGGGAGGKSSGAGGTVTDDTTILLARMARLEESRDSMAMRLNRFEEDRQTEQARLMQLSRNLQCMGLQLAGLPCPAHLQDVASSA